MKIDTLLTTWSEALDTHDVTALADLLADDFLFINLHKSSGGDNKVDYLEWLKGCDYKIHNFVSLHEDDTKLVGTHKVSDPKRDEDSTVMFCGTLKDGKLQKWEFVQGFTPKD